MLPVYAVPLLLALLVGLLLGFVVAGLLGIRAGATREISAWVRGDMLPGMLVLGAFAMGVFVTYALLGPR
jgi:hypothetical protein